MVSVGLMRWPIRCRPQTFEGLSPGREMRLILNITKTKRMSIRRNSKCINFVWGSLDWGKNHNWTSWLVEEAPLEGCEFFHEHCLSLGQTSNYGSKNQWVQREGALNRNWPGEVKPFPKTSPLGFPNWKNSDCPVHLPTKSHLKETKEKCPRPK